MALLDNSTELNQKPPKKQYKTTKDKKNTKQKKTNKLFFMFFYKTR